MKPKEFTQLSNDELIELVQSFVRSVPRKDYDAIAKVSKTGEWYDGQHGCLWGELVIAHGGQFVKQGAKYVPGNPETTEMCEHALATLQDIKTRQKMPSAIKFFTKIIKVKQNRVRSKQ